MLNMYIVYYRQITKRINMDVLKKGWFSEINDAWPGICLSLHVKEVIHREKSEFQEILIVETHNHGKALILDGIMQCTEFDEFSYQEMISFLPLNSHPDPKNVLIVGGGDGGVAREVSKHPLVQAIDIVEIDNRVVEACKKYIPSMAKGFQDPRMKLIIADGIKHLENIKNTYDVIITDSSDPVGPADALFQLRYFSLMKEALKEDGIVVTQAGGSPWYDLNTSIRSFINCKRTFAKSAYAYASVPTYPSGQIGFVLGSKNEQTNFSNPMQLFSEEFLEKNNIRYYTSKIHSAAFILPRTFEKMFLQ